MPRVERAKYERFAQLLIHLPDNIINEHSSTMGESCLKRLQYENLLEAEPYPPNRYDETTAPDLKKPATANPRSSKNLHQRWVLNDRGIISVLEKDQWNLPEENEHVMKTIPHILQCAQDGRQLIPDMCNWALEVEKAPLTFQSEAYTDGDVFQLLAALARVNFFNHDTGTEEESEVNSVRSDDHQDTKVEYAEKTESGDDSDSDGVLDLADIDSENEGSK